MSLNAKSAKSVRKQDLTSQKTPFVAFKSFSFAHQATLGQTTISLTALTTPTSYAAQGFLQPSVSDLQAANLLLYKRNLRLHSTFRGPLLEYDAYVVTGSATIRLNFTAEDGEIFVGVVSDVAKTGLQMIDAAPLVSTGTLTAGTSDYVVGQAFSLNKYSSMQVGDVLVFIEGQQVFRNAGNATASVSANGQYEELNAGSGLSNTIRFNTVDPLKDRAVLVISNGMLAERPDGSLRAAMETLAGQNDAIATTLAVLAGVPRTNFQSAPNSVDLQSFGQRVVAMEANRARIDLANVWTTPQAIPGRTDGATVPAGYPGEKITWTTPPGTQSATTTTTDWTNAFLTATPGTWLFFASIMATVATGSVALNASYIVVSITDSSNNVVQEMEKLIYISTSAANSITSETSLAFSFPAYISANTIYKIRIQRVDANGVGTASAINTATQRSQFFGVRMGQ